MTHHLPTPAQSSPTPEPPPIAAAPCSTSLLQDHAAEARRTSGRRRLVDPTTCDLDYTPEELAFMTAMQAYKLRSGRMFPTWSEVLEVLQGLGYAKVDADLAN